MNTFFVDKETVIFYDFFEMFDVFVVPSYIKRPSHSRRTFLDFVLKAVIKDPHLQTVTPKIIRTVVETMLLLLSKLRAPARTGLFGHCRL